VRSKVDYLARGRPPLVGGENMWVNQTLLLLLLAISCKMGENFLLLFPTDKILCKRFKQNQNHCSS